jgi:hypothetical protein
MKGRRLERNHTFVTLCEGYRTLHKIRRRNNQIISRESLYAEVGIRSLSVTLPQFMVGYTADSG